MIYNPTKENIMTLNVDISKIKDYEKVCYPMQKEGNFFQLPYSAATNYLVIASGAIGMSEITQFNYVEVMARHKFLQKDIELTLEDVKAHIGLSTNVADENLDAWLKRIGKSHFQSILYETEREDNQDKK